MQSVARAALLGARGNSGVILSQLIRGAAEELVSRPGQLIDATLIGAALANAADRAYSSVRDPAEGTILTVAREMAHKIVTDVAHSPESPRLGPATEPREQDRAIAEALERAVAAGAGLGQARSRAAGGAARGRRRRRRRLRADDHLRRRRGGAARRRAARRSTTTRRRASPTPSTARHLPLLHELRGHRQRAEPGALHRAARGARRLGAGRGRRDHAEGAPAHRRARAGHRGVRRAPARSRAWTSPTCALQVAERDERLPARAAAPRAERERGDARSRGARRRRRRRARVRCGAVAVVSGEGLRAAVPRAGRAHDRRRPDAQPLDLRPAGRHPRGAGRGGGACCPTART